MLRFIFLSLVFFSHILIGERSYSQNQDKEAIIVLDKRINEKFNNIPAKEALKIISEKSKINFCYNSANLPVDFLVNLTLVNKTIEEALKLIFQTTTIQLICLGDHVVIKKVKNEIYNTKDSSSINKAVELAFIEPSNVNASKSKKVQQLNKEYRQYLKNNYDIIFREDINSDSIKNRFNIEQISTSRESIYVPKSDRKKWFLQVAFKKPLIKTSLDYENIPSTTIKIVSENYSFVSNYGGELSLGYFFTKKLYAYLGIHYSEANQKLIAIDYSITSSNTAPQKFTLEVKTQDVKTTFYSFPIELGYSYKPKRFGVSASTGIHVFLEANRMENFKSLYLEQNRYPNEEYLNQNPDWFFDTALPTSNEFTKPIYGYEQKIAAKTNYALVVGFGAQYSLSSRVSVFANGKGYYFLDSFYTYSSPIITLQMWSVSIGLQYSW